MKKILLGLLCLSTIHNVNAQNKTAETIGGIAAAVGGIAAAVAAVEQIKEEWELFATDYVLQKYDYDAFELKINGLDSKSKNFDPSSISVLAFNVAPIDYEMGSVITEEKFTLLVFLDSGWKTSYGIDVTKVVFEKFDKTRWNDLYKTYLELASKTEIESPDRVPVFSNDIKRQIKGVSPYKQIVVPSRNEVYGFTGSYTSFGTTRLINKGLAFKNKVQLPFAIVDGDTYYAKDYSDEFKLIFNEKSLGLFIKELNRLVQIKNSLVNDISSYLNN